MEPGRETLPFLPPGPGGHRGPGQPGRHMGRAPVRHPESATLERAGGHAESTSLTTVKLSFKNIVFSSFIYFLNIFLNRFRTIIFKVAYCVAVSINQPSHVKLIDRS